MRGRAEILPPGAGVAGSLGSYARQVPLCQSLKPRLSNALYAFTPRWMRLIDNRRGFGFQQEWKLA